MKSKFLLPLLILSISFIISCKEEKTSSNKPVKVEQVYAETDYGFAGQTDKISLKMYSDSTYTCIKFEKGIGHEKLEKFDGFFSVINDTINFSPFNFKPNHSSKAVLKNNFIEFVDGEYPLKMEIKTTTLKQKSNLNFEKLKDYALFTYNENYYNPIRYFGYKPQSIQLYDLKQSDLEEVDSILKKCFAENNSELEDVNTYVKQCIAIINPKQEIEVYVKCICKHDYTKGKYKFYIIYMHDGGNCNVNVTINLTKHTYSGLNIAGEA